MTPAIYLMGMGTFLIAVGVGISCYQLGRTINLRRKLSKAYKEDKPVFELLDRKLGSFEIVFRTYHLGLGIIVAGSFLLVAGGLMARF